MDTLLFFVNVIDKRQGQPKLNEDVLHSILAKITTESTKKPPKAS